MIVEFCSAKQCFVSLFQTADECNGAMETLTTPSSGTDQYWTVAPPPVYAVDAAASPAAAASYFSPMFFQVRSELN